MEKKLFIWIVTITTPIIGIFFMLSAYTLLPNAYAAVIATALLIFASMPANKSKDFDIIIITATTAFTAMFTFIAIIAIFLNKGLIAFTAILGATISFIVMLIFGLVVAEKLQIQKSEIFIPVAMEFTIIITAIIVIANHYYHP